MYARLRCGGNLPLPRPGVDRPLRGNCRPLSCTPDNQVRCVFGSAPYQKPPSTVRNMRAVLKKVLRQISCCQVKQVWKILIQRSRSEARPYILLLIHFILLFRPSISPLLIEYFMAFLMGEMSRWTLFTKLTTSP